MVLFLLVSTPGITLSLHYCGGDLVSTSINSESKSCCDGAGCCENKTLHIGIEDDYINQVRITNVEAVDHYVPTPVFLVVGFSLPAEDYKAAGEYYYPPPPSTLQTRLALMQAFLC